MNMNLAILVAASATLVLFVYMRRSARRRWQPVITGERPAGPSAGPYRSTGTLVDLRYGAPIGSQLAALLAFATFFALLPMCWIGGLDLCVTWLGLALLPFLAAIKLLAADRASVPAGLLVTWPALAVFCAAIAGHCYLSGYTNPDPGLDPRVAVAATTPAALAVGLSAFLQRRRLAAGAPVR